MENYAKIIDAGDMSGNITSDVLNIEHCKHVSLELHAASATHVGTVAVQVSNTGDNWNALTLSSVPTAAAGAAFDAVVELHDKPFRKLRVVYTAGGGAGSLDCVAVTKE